MQVVKQLYYVVTTKQLFLEWLLEVNKSIDMRTAPKAVKRNMIHDEDVLKMRWDLCLGCEFLKDDSCLECGCFMKVKHKLAQAKCPIGKWDRYVA